MARIATGPLEGFFMPEYEDGSIVNLMASIIRSRGGASPHADLAVLTEGDLAGATHVVYCVVDGVGRHQLDRFLASGRGGAFFGRHPSETITTVFPATTAAAVTTFATGVAPAEHGVLSWFLHLPDLGMVSTILPVTTRTGTPAVPDDFDLRRYLACPRPLESTLGRRVFLAFGDIPGSRYSRAGTRWTGTSSFESLSGLEHAAVDFVRGAERGLAYVYWPEHDTLCHQVGTAAEATVRHLEEIDEALGRLAAALAGTDTMLIVVADHGLVDTPSRAAINLAALPGFYDCLALVPSGDARLASCFVRPRQEQRFLELVEEHLQENCVCLEGEALIESGAFGGGTHHAALRGRVGDYVLLATGAAAFAYPLAGGTAHFCVGNHGGMSHEEVLVPLYALRC